MWGGGTTWSTGVWTLVKIHDFLASLTIQFPQNILIHRHNAFLSFITSKTFSPSKTTNPWKKYITENNLKITNTDCEKNCFCVRFQFSPASQIHVLEELFDLKKILKCFATYEFFEKNSAKPRFVKLWEPSNSLIANKMCFFAKNIKKHVCNNKF